MTPHFRSSLYYPKVSHIGPQPPVYHHKRWDPKEILKLLFFLFTAEFISAHMLWSAFAH